MIKDLLNRTKKRQSVAGTLQNCREFVERIQTLPINKQRAQHAELLKMRRSLLSALDNDNEFTDDCHHLLATLTRIEANYSIVR